jgi:hypothetical protein
MQILKATEGTKFPLSQVLRERALVHLRRCDFDTIVSYADLTKVVGLDIVEDKRGRHAVLQAARILLREDRKKLVNVKTVGYRIVRPNEQRVVAEGEQRAAVRRFKRALATVTYVHLDQVPPEEQAKLLMDQARIALTLAVQRRLAKQKTFPTRDQLALPSGERLVEMFKKRA